LFIGATLGGAYGVALDRALPGAHIDPGALGLVGMAGLVSGATHAPLTAIMMVFEMTGDYGLILPLMLTSVLAYLIARRAYPESIYTEWLVRRGVVLTHGADAAILARVTVGECVNRSPVVIPQDAGLPSMLERVRSSRQTDFPVVDDAGRVVGMITQAELREAMENGAGTALPGLIVAADVAAPRFDRVAAEDSLLTALRRLGTRDVNALPVVGADDRLEGIVSRQDLLAAYERQLTAERH
jgi:CIC family chloride channel protein